MFFDNYKKVSIGDGSHINFGCKFYVGDAKNHTINIGANCDIAPCCLFVLPSHEKGDENRRAGANTYKSINVQDGCWIGANSTILPGVTIGQGCIIAAGALVNKDCEPNSLYAGVPARLIKKLDN